MNPKATITAVGKYVPEKVLTNFDLEKMVETNDEWIRTRTGIKERHIAADDEATSAMAVKAFRNLQENFEVDPAEIDCIIVATVTPDMIFPSTACLIQEAIGAKDAWGFDLSAACSGYLYGLETAARFIESGRYKKVLLVGADTMSAITNYEDRNTCILFGDGAGVTLIEPAENQENGLLDSMLFADGSGAEYLYMPAGGSKLPASHETVEQNLHYLRQDGRTVFKYAVNGMANVTKDILDRNNLTGEDVAFFIPHQANKRIIDATAKKVGLRDEQVVVNIDKYANTTAATIPLGLSELTGSGKVKNGDLIAIATFGAGFTWGSALLRWGK